MRFLELQPQWEHDGYLTFTCPSCVRDPEKSRYGNCLIALPIKPEHLTGWDTNGKKDFEKVSLTPSIWHHCESDPHFFITDGEIVFA